MRQGQVYANGIIPYQRYRAWQLAGRTVGIVGLGAVGRAAKWRLEGVGMHVVSYDPYNPDAKHSLEELLAEADVVSMHAMVTPETTGMIGAEQLAMMKPGAIYVNTARAMLHDTDALTAALQSGHLGGAGLDHFVGENLPTDHPLIGMTNVVLTPHALCWTDQCFAGIGASDVRAVLDVAHGRDPAGVVNKAVLASPAWRKRLERFRKS